MATSSFCKPLVRIRKDRYENLDIDRSFLVGNSVFLSVELLRAYLRTEFTDALLEHPLLALHWCFRFDWHYEGFIDTVLDFLVPQTLVEAFTGARFLAKTSTEVLIIYKHYLLL